MQPQAGPARISSSSSQAQGRPSLPGSLRHALLRAEAPGLQGHTRQRHSPQPGPAQDRLFRTELSKRIAKRRATPLREAARAGQVHDVLDENGVVTHVEFLASILETGQKKRAAAAWCYVGDRPLEGGRGSRPGLKASITCSRLFWIPAASRSPGRRAPGGDRESRLRGRLGLSVCAHPGPSTDRGPGWRGRVACGPGASSLRTLVSRAFSQQELPAAPAEEEARPRPALQDATSSVRTLRAVRPLTSSGLDPDLGPWLQPGCPPPWHTSSLRQPSTHLLVEGPAQEGVVRATHQHEEERQVGAATVPSR